MSKSLPGGKVSLLWGTPIERAPAADRVQRAAPTSRRSSTASTQVERVKIGDAGAWFQGPHVVMFQDRDGRFRESHARLARNTLVWQVGDVTLRLEGGLTKDEALRIAGPPRKSFVKGANHPL